MPATKAIVNLGDMELKFFDAIKNNKLIIYSCLKKLLYLVVVSVIIFIATLVYFAYAKEKERIAKLEVKQDLEQNLAFESIKIEKKLDSDYLGKGYIVSGRIVNTSAIHTASKIYLALSAYDCPSHVRVKNDTCIIIGQDGVFIQPRIPPNQARDIRRNFHNDWKDNDYRVNGHLLWGYELSIF